MKTTLKTTCILLICCWGLPAVILHAADSTVTKNKTAEATVLAQEAQDKLDHASSQTNFQEAARLLKQAVALDPNNLDVRMTLGWVYLDKLHEPHAAYSYLATVVKHRPKDVNARKLFALACSQTGRPQQAAREFRQASLLQPDDLWIRANLARSLARLGEYKEAENIYAEILKSDPTNADARLGRAELEAWRGDSAGSLEILDALIRENPTNIEALTLRGDVHRWDWDLSGARQDYQQVLGVEENNYGARTGLREAKIMGASDVNVKAYQFKDTTDFQREYVEAGTRIHLTDKAYVYGRADGWRFSQTGFADVDRVDGALGLEYHWARWLETSIEGNVFNYEHGDPFFGGGLSAKLTPVPGSDIYVTLSGNQPFISSMSAVTNSLKQDSVGFGLDTKLIGRLSLQNSLQVARISDDNHWWEVKPQLSYRIFDKPATFIRVEYDYLSYDKTNATYWTPQSRNVVSPVFDTTIPLGKWGHVAFDARAPYVFDASEFGYQFEGGPVFDLSNTIQLGGSYLYASIPGDRGTAPGSTSPPWSGKGWQAFLRIRF